MAVVFGLWLPKAGRGYGGLWILVGGSQGQALLLWTVIVRRGGGGSSVR